MADASRRILSELVKMMVGRELKELEPRPFKAGPPTLQIEGLHTMGDRGAEALRGVDLQIRAGDILGLAGVSGNGQRELAEWLAFRLRMRCSKHLKQQGKGIRNFQRQTGVRPFCK